jgi:PilZ domain
MAISVIDLSERGFRVSSEATLEEGSSLLLKLPGIEAVRARVVWCNAGEVGCEFDEKLHTSTIDLVIASAPRHPAKIHRIFGLGQEANVH